MLTTAILVVDDEQEVRSTVSRVLSREGYEVVTAENGAIARGLLEEGNFDLVLTDLSMPEMSGLELLEAARAVDPSLVALVMSGAGTISDAVQAVQLGAIDFLEKPVGRERLLVSVRRALDYRRLRDENAELRRVVQGEGKLLGDADAIVELRRLVAKVARSEGRVLILGENGTGKELVASAIHQASSRADGPFIKLNCSAVPRDLVESELFGHERGAFTGAISSRRGRFELAHQGTLFLDEIGDMPLEMQTKLLRVLQEGQLERVGGSRSIEVDVRVIAATHRDLPTMVNEGSFREDLYYRLNVVQLSVPPLRDRLADVPRLANEFLHAANTRNRRQITGFHPDALGALSGYDYPGNVRELQNLVERMVILADHNEIGVSDVTAALPHQRAGKHALYRPGLHLKDLLEDLERQILRQAIDAHGGRAAAARALDVERSFFYKKCKRLGIGDEA
ncbi:MAG: sigma-54 dependent transcriptional regulator [Myxococcota bacterium]